MKAGRELDALVGEEVMGWRDSEPDRINWEKSEGNLAPYSTDISAAWEVVERLNEKGYSVGVMGWGENGNGVTVEVSWGKEKRTPRGKMYQPVDVAEVEACAAPHAICLAALEACGVEVET